MIWSVCNKLGGFRTILLTVGVYLLCPIHVFGQTHEDSTKHYQVKPAEDDRQFIQLESLLKTYSAQEQLAEQRLKEIELQQSLLQQRQAGVSEILQSSAASDSPPGLGVTEGDTRIAELTSRLFELIEGNAGALIMVLAGIAALISAAFGAYRSAISLLVVAVGAFILRSLVDIFFNYTPPN